MSETTTPQEETTLEGAVFVFKSPTERQEAIDKAFHYRGDVTLELSNGKKVQGYLSNRNPQAPLPSLELFLPGETTPQSFLYSDIISLAFTGEDTANGKSWRDWVEKKEAERQAEAEALRQASKSRGEL